MSPDPTDVAGRPGDEMHPPHKKRVTSGPSGSVTAPFPFSAVVGQEEAQQALLLGAIDPGIGGVLLRGEKGSAKSTLARGLAALLPRDAPFVELPVGATEDRVLGSLDLNALVAGANRHSGRPGLQHVDADDQSDEDSQEGATGDRGKGPADAFRPGLLDAAHGGVLYVDEVNLLPDQIVDGLLDAAASGINRVERDGVSHEHPARFVLVGSMNPEEGELRPQLLDRFGLAVDVRSPTDPAVRAEAVRRRLAHDAGRTPVHTGDTDKDLRKLLADARPAELPDQVVTFAAALAVAVGAESLRADLVLCRAAAALAGWEGRKTATEGDVERVAPLALGHRRRRRPFEPPTLPSEDLDSALEAVRNERERAGETSGVGDRTRGEDPTGDDAETATGNDQERARPDPTAGSQQPAGDDDGHDPPPSSEPERPADGRRDNSGDGTASARGDGSDARRDEGARWDELAGDRLDQTPPRLGLRDSGPRQRSKIADDGTGRVAGHGQPGRDGPRGVAVVPTLRAMTERRAADPQGPVLQPADVREPRRLQRDKRTIVLVVDTSGSMGTAARVTAATGAVLGLLADAYLTRDQVALVAFRGDEASEVLPPTGSVELARARIADLPTGGSTPLAGGIAAGLATAQRAAAKESTPLLVVLTDGRATGDPEALDRARSASQAVADTGIETIVLDAEDGQHLQRLGLAAELATLMNARHLHLSSVTASEVESAVRATL